MSKLVELIIEDVSFNLLVRDHILACAPSNLVSDSSDCNKWLVGTRNIAGDLFGFWSIPRHNESRHRRR